VRERLALLVGLIDAVVATDSFGNFLSSREADRVEILEEKEEADARDERDVRDAVRERRDALKSKEAR
jgi:hypothetical protein